MKMANVMQMALVGALVLMYILPTDCQVVYRKRTFWKKTTYFRNPNNDYNNDYNNNYNNDYDNNMYKRSLPIQVQYACTFFAGDNNLECSNFDNFAHKFNCTVESKLNVLNGIWKHWSHHGLAFGENILDHSVSYYNLYPHNSESWLNAEFNSTLHFGIYHEKPSNFFTGLKVVDQSCWNKIQSQFNAITTSDLVHVKGVEQPIKFFGYVHFE